MNLFWNMILLFVDNCELKTDVYEFESDTWSGGPLLKYPVYTIPCLVDLGSSENLIITYTKIGTFMWLRLTWKLIITFNNNSRKK